MAFATSLCRESLARSSVIHSTRSLTSGAMSLRRTKSRSSGGNPLILRSSMKMASILRTC